MEQERSIRTITLLLAFTAGFCDTVTYVAANELFSAHVTGNFIVFAYGMIHRTDGQGWQKLLTFPVFIISVMAAEAIIRKKAGPSVLLTIEGLLLIIAGLAALSLKLNGDEKYGMTQLIAMAVVVAMGFQNTFGKLFNKATYGLTTVMTGNVTQAAMDVMSVFGAKPFDPETLVSLKKQLVLIFGFLSGCVSGALIGGRAGLAAVLLPGFILLCWLIKKTVQDQPV